MNHTFTKDLSSLEIQALNARKLLSTHKPTLGVVAALQEIWEKAYVWHEQCQACSPYLIQRTESLLVGVGRMLRKSIRLTSAEYLNIQ